jgi:hypothetical protein
MVVVRDCSNRIESHILVQLNSLVVRSSDFQEALFASVEFQSFHGRDHKLSSDAPSAKVGHNSYRHDVSLPDHSESPEVGKAELKSAHYVSDNMIFALSDNECFRTALVDFHEEIRAIVLWKADPVYLDDRREIVWSKGSEKIGRFQQTASAQEEIL